jgi:hypothetical protein
MGATLQSGACLRAQAIRRPFHYAIIDEADSVLIDDCRNPLVISSAPDDVAKERFVTAHQVCPASLALHARKCWKGYMGPHAAHHDICLSPHFLLA